ncbi:MAG: AAA family ATPase, partial [Polyangia bacterium]
MLNLLRVSGFALIDEVEVPLGPGLTVITGETGAGKSILVEALGLLRGGRASAEMVRAGCEEARVEAVFELPAGWEVRERLLTEGRAV